MDSVYACADNDDGDRRSSGWMDRLGDDRR